MIERILTRLGLQARAPPFTCPRRRPEARIVRVASVEGLAVARISLQAVKRADAAQLDRRDARQPRHLGL